MSTAQTVGESKVWVDKVLYIVPDPVADEIERLRKVVRLFMNELDFVRLQEARVKMTVKNWKRFILAVMLNLTSTVQIIGDPDNPDWLEMFLLYSKPGDISKAIDKALSDE